MTDAALLSAASFLVFTVLLLFSAISTLARAVRYSRAGTSWPRLLVRDLILVGCLGIDVALILFARFLGIGPLLTGNLGWIALTSGLAIVAIGTYALFEFRVIERVSDRPVVGPVGPPGPPGPRGPRGRTGVRSGGRIEASPMDVHVIQDSTDPAVRVTNESIE